MSQRLTDLKKMINVFKEPDTYKTFCKVLENKTPMLSLVLSFRQALNTYGPRLFFCLTYAKYNLSNVLINIYRFLKSNTHYQTY